MKKLYIIHRKATGEVIGFDGTFWKEGSDCKKIILTTDQDLIGVQAIDDEFLEWFVNNPNCEEVEIELDYDNGLRIIDGKNLDYYCIILKEKSKQETERERVCNCGLKESEHNVRHPFIPRLEPKQETLEEAAIRYEETDFNTTPTEETSQMMIQRAFINGALWQAERMYSEEEVLALYCSFDANDRTFFFGL